MSCITCVYIGEAIARYGFGGGHPFGPHRMGAFWDEAQIQGLARQVQVCDPVTTTREKLQQFHTPDYVSLVEARSRTGQGALDYGDTPAFFGVFEAASHVVGSVLDAVDRIHRGACRRAFVPIAGLHHARPERAGGFCVFNDAGVAIHTLRAQYGVQRIAYVDIDAHHGDGVFYAFESDPELFFADLHQDGRTLYPGTGHAGETGRGAGAGKKINIPLPPGAGDTHFFQAWHQVDTFLQEAKPEFIILQCGADSIAGDPITQLRLSPAAHFHVTTRLVQIAEELGHGRVLALGGGGYNPTNIAKGWCSVVRAFLETPGPESNALSR